MHTNRRHGHLRVVMRGVETTTRRRRLVRSLMRCRIGRARRFHALNLGALCCAHIGEVASDDGAMGYINDM